MSFLSAFIFGALSAIANLILEILFLSGLPPVLTLFTLGPLIEESTKLIFLFRWKHFFSFESLLWPQRFLVLSLFGLGFAFTEIATALFSGFSHFSIQSGFIITGIHILTSVLLGTTLFRWQSPKIIGLSLIIATILHTLYNISIASLQ